MQAPTLLLRYTKKSTECDYCGNVIPRRGEVTVLSGDTHRVTGAALPTSTACAICAVLFWDRPQNYDQFYAKQSDVDPVVCLSLVDSGRCDAGCILANDDGACDCRCEGKHHGSLRRAIESMQPLDRSEERT